MIRAVLAVLVITALLLTAGMLWRHLDQPVRSVRVEGALTLAEQQAIRAVVSQGLDGGLLSLSLDDLAARIRSLSWPRTVMVRRVWPAGLVIRVEKESVVANWGPGGYLTSAGKIVQLADGQQDLPVLAAAVSSPRQAMEMYQMLQVRVQPLGLDIRKLEEDGLGEWLLTLNDEMTVALGNEDLTRRMQRFLLVYRQLQSMPGIPQPASVPADGRPGAHVAPSVEHAHPVAHAVAHMDTRYGSGVAVRWADPGPASGAPETDPLLAARPAADGVAESMRAAHGVR